MQNTTNLNLKKPDYTDFADIQDINDNMDALDEAIHDTQNSVATFTSSDVADGSATSWTTVPKVASGETHKSIFAKMSQMFKNIRFLYKMLGTTDISSIGNGTVTGGLSSLNSSFIALANRDYAVGTISIKGAGGNWQARSLNGLNTAFLFFCFDSASSNITTADKLFTLDQNVRPSTTMHVPGFIITDAGKVAKCWYNITADGGVYQGVTGYCRAGYGFGFYTTY